jgi:hypothetical protein
MNRTHTHETDEPRKTRMRLRVLGPALLAGAIFLAGGSGDDDTPDSAGTTGTTPTATATMAESMTPTATEEAMSDVLTSDTGAASLYAGLTHLLQRSGVSPEQAVRLAKIDAAGRHLLALINDILDLSKIEAGRLNLEHTAFHLSAILDHVHSLIAQQAEAKGLVVVIDPDAVPNWLRGDATRLVRVLEWIAQGPQVKCVLVNVFAGITHLGEFSRLLVQALREAPALKVPVVTRLVGNGLDDARAVLGEAGIAVEPDLNEALALVREALARS